MTRLSLSAILLPALIVCSFAQQPAPKRPKITAVDHVDFYTTSPEANEHLYATVLGLAASPPLEPGQARRFIAGTQWVGYSPAPDPKVTNRLDHVAFRTDDCEALRKYLAASGVKVPDSVTKWKEGSLSFMVNDPEGNQIEFVQRSSGVVVHVAKAGDPPPAPPDPVSRRIIHAGFIVRDRDAEDRFYKDILGFRPYWFGGMHPERTDWVSIQVPDGTDWIEYMLNQPNPDARISGIMNHVAMGVKDMNAAQMKMEAHGWKPTGTEHSQIGRDGKLQLNVYDPDLTRVELMEFAPVDKPCCSEFMGQHPSEDH